MTEASIAITKEHNNQWELTVRIPAEWLAQFEANETATLWNERVTRLWGRVECTMGPGQYMRIMSQPYVTLAYAEQQCSAILHEITELKALLRKRERYEYTLNLDPQEETLQHWVRHTGTDQDGF